MAQTSLTKTDRFIRWAKNNLLFAIPIVLIPAIIAIGAAVAVIRALFPPSLEVAAVRVIDRPPEIAAFRKRWLPAETTTVVWDTVTEVIADVRSSNTNGALTMTLTGRQDTVRRPVTGALGNFPIIDVILRNPTPEPVVITNVDVAAQLVDRGSYGACNYLGPTWAYHLLLRSDSVKQSVSAPLEQRVLPGDADRFLFVLGMEAFGEATYEATFKLTYNGRRTISLGTHTIHFQFRCPSAGPKLEKPYILRR